MPEVPVLYSSDPRPIEVPVLSPPLAVVLVQLASQGLQTHFACLRLFIFVVLGMEPRAKYTLSKH